MWIACTTGLSRYLDARSKLLDARKSAIAVWQLLDEAQARSGWEVVDGCNTRSA